MSAYASLPGSFLPPFFAFGPSPDDSSSKGILKGTSKGMGGENDTSELAATSQGSADASTPTPAAALSTEATVSEADCSPIPRPKLPSLAAASLPASEIVVAIQSARVDPMRLIQSFSSRRADICKTTANCIAQTPGPSSAAVAGAERKEIQETPSQLVKNCPNSSSWPSLCLEDSDSDEDDEASFYDYDDDFTNSGDDHCGSGAQDSNAAGDGNLQNTGDHELDAPVSDKESASAIQFELSINFYGRKYTATRAFSTFIQLRNDLLRELNISTVEDADSAPNIHHARSRRSNRTCLKKSNSDSAIDLLHESGNTKIAPLKMTGISEDTPKEVKDTSNVSIPELPSVSPENFECAKGGPYSVAANGVYALSGVACRGFAYLQATAKLYCPEMEKWLMQVVDAVPCSPSLSRFLWEPLASSTASWDMNNNFKFEEHCASRKLDSPKESSCRDEMDKFGNLGVPLKHKSAFAKPPHSRNKPRSHTLSPGGGFYSLGSIGSLNSIEEGDSDKGDDDR